VRIDTPTGSETNPAAIKDFVVNASKDVFDAINDKLQIMKASLDLKVKNASCDKCKHTFDVTITMDQANFFRSKILNLPLPEILQEVKRLDAEGRAIKKEVLKMCWYMRGLAYSEGMNLGFEEREIIGEIIKENMETTKKTNLPFF
jgi:hypothetical protein